MHNLGAFGILVHRFWEIRWFCGLYLFGWFIGKYAHDYGTEWNLQSLEISVFFFVLLVDFNLFAVGK